jgi:integrase/recombinase XerD
MTDLLITSNRALTAKEFQGLADVPPEVEWFANLGPIKQLVALMKMP